MKDKYLPIKALNESAYSFLLELEGKPFEVGRYELDGGAYVVLQSYQSKLRQNANYEAHKKYTDIQVVISGCEIISIESLDAMYKYPVITPYNEEKDVELYTPNCDGIDYVLNDGDFLIIPPRDAHAPGINVGGQGEVLKAVFKIPVK